MISKRYLNLFKVYTVSEVIAKGLNWLILIVLPQVITTENFGKISLIIAFENILLPISLNGQHITVLRFYDRFKRYRDSFFKAIAVVFIRWNIIILPIILTVIVIFYKSFPFIIILFATPLLAIREIVLNYLRVEEAKEKYFKIRVTYQIVKFVSVISFAIAMPESELLYPIGLVIALIISILQITNSLKKSLDFKTVLNVKTRFIKLFFLFGFPIIFHALSNAINMFINRYLIQYFIDERAVGIFSLAYSLSFSLFFILYIGGLVFQPFLYKSKTVDNKSERNLVLYTNAIFIFISFFAIILWFAYPIIVRYYNADYIESEKTFKVLMLSILIIPFYHQGNYRLTLKNRTQLLPIASGLAALTTIIANIVLIPKFGIIGAAYSSVAAYLVLMIFTNSFSFNIIRLKNIFTMMLLLVYSLLILFNSELGNLFPYFLIIIGVVAGTEFVIVKKRYNVFK